MPGIFCLRVQHHLVFFRETAEHFAIISILHEGKDIPFRLREDLR